MINGLLHARGALDPPPGQPRQQQNDPTPPLWRQRLPNTRRQRFAHDAIQASARWRKALGIRVSAIRRILATYKRQLVWGIETKLTHLNRDGPPAQSAAGSPLQFTPHKAGNGKRPLPAATAIVQ